MNTRVELTVGIIQRVDFVLQVGNLTEQVVVTAEARVSALVTEQQIASLPLNGRNIYQLAQLQMGVIGHINSLGLQGNDTDTFAAQGNRHRGTNYLLDGADNNNSGIGGEVSLVPSQEAVEEFRLSTTNFSPEFGRNAGAVVEVVTKSGTNEFHGSIWEYHRNAALDAREFTDRTDPAQLIQNQFGFSLGGPVEKDRAWFFGYYEGERQAFGKSVSFQTEHPAFVNTVLANPTLNSSNAGELFRRHPSLAAPSATSFTADEFMSAIVREGWSHLRRRLQRQLVCRLGCRWRCGRGRHGFSSRLLAGQLRGSTSTRSARSNQAARYRHVEPVTEQSNHACLGEYRLWSCTKVLQRPNIPSAWTLN